MSSTQRTVLIAVAMVCATILASVLLLRDTDDGDRLGRDGPITVVTADEDPLCPPNRECGYSPDD